MIHAMKRATSKKNDSGAAAQRPEMVGAPYRIPKEILHEAREGQPVELRDESAPKGARSRNQELCIVFFHKLLTHEKLSREAKIRMRDAGLQLVGGEDFTEYEDWMDEIIAAINNVDA